MTFLLPNGSSNWSEIAVLLQRNVFHDTLPVIHINPKQDLISLWQQKKNSYASKTELSNFFPFCSPTHLQKNKTWEETTPDWNTHSTYTGSFKDFLGCNLSSVQLYSSEEMAMSNKKASLLLPLCFLKLPNAAAEIQDVSSCFLLHNICVSCMCL